MTPRTAPHEQTYVIRQEPHSHMSMQRDLPAHYIIDPTPELLAVVPPETSVARSVWHMLPALLRGTGHVFSDKRRAWVRETP